jgi:MoaA/NifB/PqqE/SkfB family radical SAM enzyme
MLLVTSLATKTVCGAVGGVYAMQAGRFPSLVRIETTNACNARCTICPHRSLKRPIARMDDAMFGQIVDECAAAGCRQVHLHNFGEPLLDKSLEDRVAYAKQRGIGKVKIFSNGALLDERRAAGLIDAGLDEIKVSFDGATREEFEVIRVPLKFDVVVENIRRLVELRNERRSPMKIHVACCSTTDKQATMRSLEQLVDGFSFGKVHNWASEDYTAAPRGVRKPCSRLWKTFTILSNGDVALCCLDYDGQHLLGRIDRNTRIADVWRDAAYRRVRQLHRHGRQGELELCRGCTKAFL